MEKRSDAELELAINGVRLLSQDRSSSGGRLLDSNVVDGSKTERTGTVWTASAHIVTAVIGSGVLSLAWTMAQLGWITGLALIGLFAVVTLYFSRLLADCYRSPDPVTGRRNRTYKDAVKVNLGDNYVWLCCLAQYTNLYGTAVGYTITAVISMQHISRTGCVHYRGQSYKCESPNTPYTVAFGILQIFLSQIPNFHELWWLSTLAAVMSFGYSAIAIGLSLGKVIGGSHHGTATGLQIGKDVTQAQKVWDVFNAFGCIAFAYSFSLLLIEIQDTLRSPPPENKSMKKASAIGISVTTFFYACCGILGYLALGNHAPPNMLTAFLEPYWLVDIGHVFVIIHLVGAYQVFCQPLFAFVEEKCMDRWPEKAFINIDYYIPMCCFGTLKVNGFRALWRTLFVISVTLVAEIFPFFNDILGLLGSVGFWPITVYFPLEMYTKASGLQRFSCKWVMLQTVSLLCLLVSIAAAAGSIQGIFLSLKSYRPFQY